jgi:hypothetical protein
MVETTTRLSRAGQQRADRLAAIKAASQLPRIKVVPTTDEMRRLLKHPTGVGFSGHGGAEWPDDRFTRRRLKEGGIKLADQPAD